ncbi:glycoside hydrolase family 43 protein [Sphingomonas sp. S1-29]|uniref:glycoside hydrolase family 43 protein n=1 Tax=Sphingomonas sp. S1-29 TaxID=2991074 RepID=UPI00223FD410|nr:glycoside hydrolase family 43 protein [Sphingomonas sp. S1-29]UZK70665.1 glycoside hydrolase family 43 protein [Sphingomonas sp. S1-29]
MRSIAPMFAAMLLATTAPGVAQQAPGTASFDWFDYRGSDPIDSVVRPGPGDYRNPILQGFYPDPSITRVGEDYYLVTSTFSYFPGIPIWHSRDLVNWTQIGNAIDRPDQLDFKQLGLSRGVFAPAIEHRDGIFYILNTCVDCGGNFLVTATDPKGPWSDPVWLPDLEGAIDPSLFFEDDGTAWILNNGPPIGQPRYQGHRAIWIQRFDAKTNKTFGPRKMLVDGGVDPSKNPIWIEGPHLIQKDGWYYLTCAEGGTAEAHSQVVLRSRSPDGPFTPNPANPFLTQRGLPADRANPITSAGHADLVQLPNGDWWATFLAVRPYEGDFYNTGRETFLMPVTWENGWPSITKPGEVLPYTHARPALPPQPKPALPTNGAFGVLEQFDADKLGPQWMMMRNPREQWHRLEGGALHLRARPETLGDNANPSFLARRQQHRDATATTVVRFAPTRDGEAAGLVALQSDEYWYALVVAREGGKQVLRLDQRAGEADPKNGKTIASVPFTGTPGHPVELKITARGDRYDFAYAAKPGEWQILAEGRDGKMLSTKTAGGFVGAVFGPYATTGAKR